MLPQCCTISLIQKKIILLNFANLNFLHPQQNFEHQVLTHNRTSNFQNINKKTGLHQGKIHSFFKGCLVLGMNLFKICLGCRKYGFSRSSKFLRIMFFFQIRLLLPLELQKTQRPESALHQKKSLCCTHRLPHPFICGPFQVSFQTIFLG